MAFPGVYPSITSTLPERDFSRPPCTNTRLFSLAHFHRQHVFHGIYQLSSLDTGFGRVVMEHQSFAIHLIF
jgi:hypothetical protein